MTERNLTGNDDAVIRGQEPIETELEIEKQGNGFIVRGIGGQVGEISYKLVDVGTWVIDHIHMDAPYNGTELERQLLDLVVEEARDKGRKIIPSAPYALEQFKENAEYDDVWEKTEKEFSDTYSSDSVSS